MIACTRLGINFQVGQDGGLLAIAAVLFKGQCFAGGSLALYYRKYLQENTCLYVPVVHTSIFRAIIYTMDCPVGQEGCHCNDSPRAGALNLQVKVWHWVNLL